MRKGLIFGIQHFSIHDGEGIRTNVFLKGCPLRCQWCHNPEGLEKIVELQYFSGRCRRCGKCGFVFEHLKDTASLTEDEKKELAEGCIYGALELVGEWMTAEKVLEEVRQDMRFFRTSGGGITISGGEPMMQFEFLMDLLKKAKELSLNTAIETSGFAPAEKYKEILPYVDVFLWDYKETDQEKHKELTGVENRIILENLRVLHDTGAKIVLRCPMIPGANDHREHLIGIAELLKELNHLEGWEIMPYHKLGISKEKRLGKDQSYEFEIPSKETVLHWENVIKEYMNK